MKMEKCLLIYFFVCFFFFVKESNAPWCCKWIFTPCSNIIFVVLLKYIDYCFLSNVWRHKIWTLCLLFITHVKCIMELFFFLNFEMDIFNTFFLLWRIFLCIHVAFSCYGQYYMIAVTDTLLHFPVTITFTDILIAITVLWYIDDIWLVYANYMAYTWHIVGV